MRVLKVPYNAGNLKVKDGLELGPDAIEEASKAFYINEQDILPVLEFEELKVDNGNIKESHAMIEEKANGFGIVLGGDHSITLPSFKSFAKGKQNPGIVIFDAHPDLMHSFGTHEDYLRTLIEEGIVEAGNVVFVGLRNCDKEELRFMKENNIKRFTMKEISLEGMRETCDSVMSVAKDFSDLYISIDIDVLDPAFAPGTGYCEPGGMTTRELLYFIHRLKLLKNFKMADIVEVNPKLDSKELTVKAAAKLLTELA